MYIYMNAQINEYVYIYIYTPNIPRYNWYPQPLLSVPIGASHEGSFAGTFASSAGCPKSLMPGETEWFAVVIGFQ